MPHHRKIGPSTHATSTAPLPEERPKNIWWNNNNLMPHHGNTEPSIHATDPAAFPEIPSTGTHSFPCNFQEMRQTVLAENDLPRPCQAGRPGRCKDWKPGGLPGGAGRPGNQFKIEFLGLEIPLSFWIFQKSFQFCVFSCAFLCSELCYFSEILVLFFSVLSFVLFLVLLCARNCATFRKFLCFFSQF